MSLRPTSEVAKDIPRIPNTDIFIPENYPSDEAYLEAREEFLKVCAESEARVARGKHPYLTSPE